MIKVIYSITTKEHALSKNANAIQQSHGCKQFSTCHQMCALYEQTNFFS